MGTDVSEGGGGGRRVGGGTSQRIHNNFKLDIYAEWSELIEFHAGSFGIVVGNVYLCKVTVHCVIPVLVPALPFPDNNNAANIAL